MKKYCRFFVDFLLDEWFSVIFTLATISIVWSLYNCPYSEHFSLICRPKEHQKILNRQLAANWFSGLLPRGVPTKNGFGALLLNCSFCTLLNCKRLMSSFLDAYVFHQPLMIPWAILTQKIDSFCIVLSSPSLLLLFSARFVIWKENHPLNAKFFYLYLEIENFRILNVRTVHVSEFEFFNLQIIANLPSNATEIVKFCIYPQILGFFGKTIFFQNS